MPDTGAPWNIPYVAGTDLVADWPTDNQQQAEAIADALTAAERVKQIVTAYKTDTFTMTGATYVDVTDLTVTITPSATSSSVLVIANVFGNHNSSSSNFRLLRDATVVGANATSDSWGAVIETADSNVNGVHTTLFLLDAPATTSAITYKVQMNTTGTGTGGVNGFGNANTTARATSQLLAIEVDNT